MKKVFIIVIIVIMLLVFALVINNNNSRQRGFLNEETLNYIMYDYNYLTGNSEETTREYFEELKLDNKYSEEFMKEMEKYGKIPYEIVLKIQADYVDLINGISINEKEELDKYLLENSLIYYYEEM